jgi:hypothetical protein
MLHRHTVACSHVRQRLGAREDILSAGPWPRTTQAVHAHGGWLEGGTESSEVLMLARQRTRCLVLAAQVLERCAGWWGVRMAAHIRPTAPQSSWRTRTRRCIFLHQQKPSSTVLNPNPNPNPRRCISCIRSHQAPPKSLTSCNPNPCNPYPNPNQPLTLTLHPPNLVLLK